MKEVKTLASAARILRERREPFIMATVVEVHGSSYRRPGARLLATANGRVAGSISGGCLERELVRTAFWHTRGGPVVRRFDSTDPDAPGLGCGGVVDVLLERAEGGQDDLFAFVSAVIANEDRAAIATVIRSSDPAFPIGKRAFAVTHGLVSALPQGIDGDLARLVFPNGTVDGLIRAARVESRAVTTRVGELDLMVETVVPPPHLFVLGSGPDAAVLVTAAQTLGWVVTVWDALPSFESRGRFAGTEAELTSDLSTIAKQIDASDAPLVVVMGHHPARDRMALRMALASRAFYIGVLGPRHRTELLVEDATGMLADPRVYAPVGLDVGAETPEEIAVAIVSEILGCVRGGSHSSLRRRRSIHGAEAGRP